MAHHPTKRNTSFSYFYPDSLLAVTPTSRLFSFNSRCVRAFLRRHQFIAVMAIVLSGLVITFLLQLLSINQQVYVKAVYGDVMINSSNLALRESELFQRGDTLYVSPNSLAMIILPDNSVQLVENTRIDLISITTKSRVSQFEMYDHSNQKASIFVSQNDSPTIVSVVTGIINPIFENPSSGVVLGVKEYSNKTTLNYNSKRDESHILQDNQTNEELKKCVTWHRYADYETLNHVCGL